MGHRLVSPVITRCFREFGLSSVFAALLCPAGCMSTVRPNDSGGGQPAGPVVNPQGSGANPGIPSAPLPPVVPIGGATPPGLPVIVNTTGGSGGPKGDNQLKSAGGLSYIINAPADNGVAGKAHGLLILLHGSSASNYREFVGMMSGVAAQYQLIRVSVQAPNGSGWNEGPQEKSAALLDRLVQEDLLPKYNVSRNRIFFSGQSSGGGFLSTHFVPLFSQKYQGGAFLQCGAAPPQSAFKPSAETAKNFRLHFEITTGDPIWPDSYRQAVDVYQKAGMSLTKDNTKPGGHCAFDQQKVIADHIAFVSGQGT